MKETYTTGQHTINNQHCAAAALLYAQRAINLKRDLQKRPAKQAHILSIVCIAQRQRCSMQKEQYTLKEF